MGNEKNSMNPAHRLTRDEMSRALASGFDRQGRQLDTDQRIRYIHAVSKRPMLKTTAYRGEIIVHGSKGVLIEGWKVAGSGGYSSVAKAKAAIDRQLQIRGEMVENPGRVTDRAERYRAQSFAQQDHLAHGNALLSRARLGHEVQQGLGLSDLRAIVLPFAVRFHERIVVLLNAEGVGVQEVNQCALLAGDLQRQQFEAGQRELRSVGGCPLAPDGENVTAVEVALQNQVERRNVVQFASACQQFGQFDGVHAGVDNRGIFRNIVSLVQNVIFSKFQKSVALWRHSAFGLKFGTMKGHLVAVLFGLSAWVRDVSALRTLQSYTQGAA